MPSRAAVATGLALGMLADRLAGDPERWHPVAGFGQAASHLESVMWRSSRLAGCAYVAVTVAAPALTTALVDRTLGRRPVARTAFVAAVTWTALGGRSLEVAAERVAAAVDAGDLVSARELLPALVGRDPSGLPADEVCRATIESVAENTADAVTGPLLWGALFGPAATVAYRAANTLDAMVGHHSARYERFGWAAARLDDVLTWPAARLASVLAVVLAPVAGGDRREALRILRRDGGSHPSPNAGRVEAAYAGALGLRLGGVNRYPGRAERRPDLGDGRPAEAGDVTRATRLARAIGLASAVLLVVARGKR
jgi:adenosylcobinamide-phosphate synthase